ncbi:nonsense-mediated mRNA decay protein [Histoplasma capsulatum var. duboisii H88]|uniref:Nonsense-mediated mRNA decay protein n=1 Tax=Ajellomyces capsulatus (strain H88) TaxID=544711 RepID=A0A8A1LYD6_AJEC8|nr:nonsense-mediated mRNA decay protein [Histoplasma capsulatum var. duboisii H88]
MDRARKRELRDLNARAWARETGIFPVNKSLDSALKKNTAFIKRLRTGITAAALPTFLADIRTLSLHKYLSEIISAAYEGFCKLKTPGEIAAAVEIASALHQRFGPDEFTKQLGWLLGRGLTTPDKAQLKAWTQDVREREEKERLSRQRVLLRIVTELWLVGFLRSLDDVERPDDLGTKGHDGAGAIGGGKGSSPSDGVAKSKPAQATAKADQDKEAEPFPLEVLKDLLGHDREHVNLPLAVLFARTYSWDILGSKGMEGGRKNVEADGATTESPMKDGPEIGSGDDEPNAESTGDDPPLASEKFQLRFRNILNRYLEDVKALVVSDQKGLATQSRKNAEAYVKSGEIFEDRQANFEKQSKAHEKLVSNTQALCEILGSDMPDLMEKETGDSTLGGGSIGLVKTGEYLRGQGEGPGIWEDEEERRFYENLVDLKGKVPAVLLEDGKKKKADGDDQVKRKADGEAANGVPADQFGKGDVTKPGLTASEAANTQEVDDQSASMVNKTVGAQVDALLAKLPELQTKDSVDQLALEFCFLNSKASRNRLVKAIQEAPKGRTDLLPLYARLVATLGQYLPDIPQGLISYLDEEFRSLQRRRQKEFLGQVRTSNIRYLAELTKFGVVPEHVIFHCFKVSLDDFSRMNIEIIGNLLENCGRYLLRNPETSPRMASFLETLGRKKAAQHLGQQERMIIENAMYYVDPPQRPAIQQKERTPMELYIRKLLYLDMNKRNYPRILKCIRKLHWEEQEVVHILERIFSKPGKVRYSNIHILAILVSALYRYHQDFVIGIVDNILENITLGLEQNDFKFNQRRIAEVKYLGELYNYKIVDSPLIFDTLYRIVTFGHEGGIPAPGKINLLDMPDDFFRIRLVCTLLDTCGVCFDRGSAKKKLDFFLTFFQYYLFTKDPVPMDVDFLVQDTYALTRPQWKIATDLAEATRLFSEAVAQNYKIEESTQEADKAPEPDPDGESSSSDDGFEDDAIPDADEDKDDVNSSSDEVEETVRGPDQDHDSESEEEQIFVTRQEEQLDPEAEAEFDREFEKMMAESLQSRKFERKAMFDVPLPMRRTPHNPSSGAEENGESSQHTPNTMAFSLMTKRGNRQQTRTIDLPSDSSFAVAMKTQQQAEREEQQRIKNLVLNYDLRDDNESNDGPEKRSHRDTRTADKSSSNRSGFRSRKLQLSDVDWT